MPRGVDTELFSPLRRTRAAGDRTLVLGFVGRLSVEKNVALLAAVHDRLLERGFADFRFLIVGHGAEQQWLREHLAQASLPGVLRGVELARAYADMDLFVFPSHTDTFGNVVLEAMASGVPAIVTPAGGPRSIVEPGRTGIIADDAGFAEAVLELARDDARRAAMGRQAREYALGAGWDSVFEGVYARYAEALELPPG
jgi:glycosyltransferase involved in cell wall biosynthesis